MSLKSLRGSAQTVCFSTQVSFFCSAWIPARSRWDGVALVGTEFPYGAGLAQGRVLTVSGSGCTVGWIP